MISFCLKISICKVTFVALINNLEKNIMKRIVLTLTLAIAFLFSTDVQAQKFGYVNLGNILEAMPERVSADNALKAYQESQIAEGEGMMKILESNYNKYVEDVKAGILNQVQTQQREAEITKERDKIAAFEQEVQQRILKKRQELLEPILKKVDEAVQAVGKENGYTMIFDVSVGAMLYAVESEDATPLIKTKLGM